MILFVFFSFYESDKISGLKEWAELVASQLTQLSTFANKNKIVWRKSVVENSVYLDLITP